MESCSPEGSTTTENPPDLTDEVDRSLVHTNFTGELRFLPAGTIDKLFTVESVDTVLNNPELTAYTLASARKVFAIVLMFDLPLDYVRKGMSEVCERGISDRDLPLTKSYWKARGLPFARRNNGQRDDEAVWTTTRIRRFCEELQWAVLAPVFSINKHPYDLEPTSVLPFPKKTVKCSGAFGEVSKCEIHPSHLLDSKDEVRVSRGILGCD